jgi:hypothetical protein
MIKFETSFNNCLQSEVFKDVNAMSARIQCSYLANMKRYSIGKTTSMANNASDLSERIIQIFKQLTATEGLPAEPEEAHWDIFIKTKEGRFIWFRKENGSVEGEGYRCDQYDSDKTKQQYNPGVHRNEIPRTEDTQPKDTTSKLGHYTKDEFLDYYCNLAQNLQSLFKGREIYDLLNEKDEFLGTDDLQVREVKKKKIVPIERD